MAVARPGLRATNRHGSPTGAAMRLRQDDKDDMSRFRSVATRRWLRLIKSPLDTCSKRIADVLVDELQIEPFRIEMSTAPAFGFRMFGIGRIGHDFEEAFVSAHATDIFGRPRPRAFDAGAMFRGLVQCKKRFHLDPMAPVVAEIVDIGEAGAFFEIAKAHLPKIKDARIVIKRIFRQERDVTIAQSADPELVEMIIPPVECRLDGKVQLLEVPLARQDETTPDIQFDLVEANADLDGIAGREHGVNEQE